MNRPYQICNRCVMDTSDPGIEFDSTGVCHYCLMVEKLLPRYQFSADLEKRNLEEIERMVKASPGREGYNCILGLSGGVDSSYVALLAKDMGLKPLCVHFDNGWNSEAAVANIRAIIEHCGFDLFTYVINWNEFRDLQRSFLKAGVIDFEMLSDHAIFAALFHLRRKYKIKYVLSGTNFSTENGLPVSWTWPKMDFKNIKDIHKHYGSIPLKTFPSMTNIQWALIRRLGLGGVFLEPLNKINYTKNSAMTRLESVGWKYYGGKHYESIITKFYQVYILPNKFGVDKRRCHHSSLIRNGEMSREEAIDDLMRPASDMQELMREKSFVVKKLGFTEEEFDLIMRSKPVPHDNFKTDTKMLKALASIPKLLSRHNLFGALRASS